MKRKFTQSEKETCWSLWKEGLGFSDIGRVLSAKPGSIFTLLREHGGVRLPRPKRSQRHLDLAEREEISISLAANISIRQIACSLRRSPSTISREINKNGGRGKYRANIAETAAWKRAKRPKPAKLAINIPLKSLVIEKLQLKWSPEQISGWLKIEFPFLKNMHISPETI